MTTAIEKLNEALGAITEVQKGLEGENLILSLKAIRNVVKAMETVAKITKEEKVESEETEAGDVEDTEEKHDEEPPVEAVEDVEEAEQEVKESIEEEGQEVEKSIEEVNAEKPAKWVFSKELKLDTFNRMCEKAWADSGLQDESIKKAVYNELAKWYKMSLKSPWAGYMRYYKYRPHSNEELEKDMYEKFEMQFSQYDGYKKSN